MGLWPDANERADQLASLCRQLKRIHGTFRARASGDDADAAEYVETGLDEAIAALTARECGKPGYAPSISVVVSFSPPASGIGASFVVDEFGMSFSLMTHNDGDRASRDTYVQWGAKDGGDLAEWFMWAESFARNDDLWLSVERNHV